MTVEPGPDYNVSPLGTLELWNQAWNQVPGPTTLHV